MDDLEPSAPDEGVEVPSEAPPEPGASVPGTPARTGEQARGPETGEPGAAGEPEAAGEPSSEPVPAQAEALDAGDPTWPRCEWCSTANPPAAETCRSCGAALKPSPEMEERSIYGLTEVDPGLIEHDIWLRSLKDRQKAARSRVLRSGPKAPAEPRTDYAPADEEPAVQPPADRVRSEMARMAAEAAAARAQAEAEARRADELIAAQDQAAEEAVPVDSLEPASEPLDPATPPDAAEPAAPEEEPPAAPPATPPA